MIFIKLILIVRFEKKIKRFFFICQNKDFFETAKISLFLQIAINLKNVKKSFQI